MRKSVSVAALIVATVFAFSATPSPRRVRASASSETQGSAVEVKIDNFVFGPQALTISAGTTVTWINHDDIPHTVVSSDGLFKSKVLDTDDQFSFTFSKPGTYPYFCSIHPKMTAKIIAQ
jgi:plastocyanin